MNLRFIDMSNPPSDPFCDRLSIALRTSSPLAYVFKDIPENNFPDIIIKFFNLNRIGSEPVLIYDLSGNDQINLISQFISFADPKNKKFNDPEYILVTSLLLELFCSNRLKNQQEFDEYSKIKNNNFLDFMNTDIPSSQWQEIIVKINQFQNEIAETIELSRFNKKNIIFKYSFYCKDLNDDYLDDCPINIRQKTTAWEAFVVKSQINKITPGPAISPPKI